jgi:hypothetical protein
MANKTGPTITIARKSGKLAFAKRMAGLSKLAAYVGVPAANKDARSEQLLDMASRAGKKKAAKLKKAAKEDVNNAELLFIFEKGSPLHKQPSRPVLKPAIEGAKESISNEIKASIKASLAGDSEKAKKKMMRAALAGQNAARRIFTQENGWAPNAESTIKAKGSDVPGIDTGAMRAAIIGIVREE